MMNLDLKLFIVNVFKFIFIWFIRFYSFFFFHINYLFFLHYWNFLNVFTLISSVLSCHLIYHSSHDLFMFELWLKCYWLIWGHSVSFPFPPVAVCVCILSFFFSIHYCKLPLYSYLISFLISFLLIFSSSSLLTWAFMYCQSNRKRVRIREEKNNRE